MNFKKIIKNGVASICLITVLGGSGINVFAAEKSLNEDFVSEPRVVFEGEITAENRANKVTSAIEDQYQPTTFNSKGWVKIVNSSGKDVNHTTTACTYLLGIEQSRGQRGSGYGKIYSTNTKKYMKNEGFYTKLFYNEI